MIEFIFMLTHNDVTVDDAPKVLDELLDSGLRYIGFKDIGPPPEVLAQVTAMAHEAAMEVMLEVVSTEAEHELRSLHAAREIGVDWVLGGTHADEGAAIFVGSGVRYCPFPGTIVGHPSVLKGSIDAIAADAARLTSVEGVHGLDLLAYRHEDADPVALTRAVVSAAHGPVIAAGSVATLEQIANLEAAGAWGFTIGGAIFEQLLPGGPTVAGQVAAVLQAAGATGGGTVNARKRPSLVDEVRQGLLDDLVGGKLERGAKLPNENQLADRFAVSRATVREAVLGLLEAGYLSRRHGSGTYVTNAPRSRHALDSTVSYTAMIRESGHEPGETVVAKGVRVPTELERKLLDLAEGERVVEVERVRLADRRPVIYSRDRIPEALVADVAGDALDSSLYVILDWAGHEVARASAQLIPTLADAKLAKLLGIKRGTPLLHVDQVDYDARGRAVMLSQEWHVADAFELIVNRRAG